MAGGILHCPDVVSAANLLRAKVREAALLFCHDDTTRNEIIDKAARYSR